MKIKTTQTVIIHGFIIEESGQQSKVKKFILIENGFISQISELKPQTKGNEITIKLSDQQVIFPGFLDLHTHIGYNMIPNWDSPLAPWDNRHEWRNNSKYKNDIEDVYRFIRTEWGEDEKNTIDDYRMLGEIQAVAGGTTVLQEPEVYKNGVHQSDHILIRSTGRSEELGFASDKLILSATDFYKPQPIPTKNGSHCSRYEWVPADQSKLKFFKDRINDDLISAILVHLSEGRTGFLLKNEGTDGYTRREFEAFITEMKKYKPEQVAKHHVSIIHGNGINTNNKEHIQFLRDYGISILWAPISNTLLYSDTLDIFKFIDNGINVALGSDWSPSGGKHAWEEAKFAYRFCSRFSNKCKTQEELMSLIFKMITTSAAKCLGTDLQLGKITKGGPADFVILEKLKNCTALETLFTCNDSSVYCVIVNGRILYGCEDVFKNIRLDFETLLTVDYQQLPKSDGVFAANKFISFNRNLNFNLMETVKKLERLLQSKDSPRKWKRSKFLASDDIEYLERIQRLEKNFGLNNCFSTL